MFDGELTAELAAARADATRHAQAATDFRAELADARRELKHSRRAAKELAQTTEELDAALAKLNRAQRGRQTLEGELEAGRSRQAVLEKQMRELHSRLTTERLGRGRGGGIGGVARSASEEGWLFSDTQGAAPGAASASTTNRNPSGSAEVRTPSAGVLLEAMTATPSSRAGGGGGGALGGAGEEEDGGKMARSHSSGALNIGGARSAVGFQGGLEAPLAIDDDPFSGQPRMSLRASKPPKLGPLVGATSHGGPPPPRPPQAPAPRLGWTGSAPQLRASSSGSGEPSPAASARGLAFGAGGGGGGAASDGVFGGGLRTSISH